MTKLKIKVTKEVFRKSMMCGVGNRPASITENCAIALAVRDIWPDATVEYCGIYVYPTDIDYISIPAEVGQFIRDFDKLQSNPWARLALPELEFEVEVPDEVINQINIDDIIKSSTLELV